MQPLASHQTKTVLRTDRLELPALSIRAVQSDGRVVEARLGVAPIIVGTAADCDIQLVDPSVSRRHCSISCTEQGVLVRDLGSKNGSFLSNAKIIEVFIQPGCSFAVGDTHLDLHVVGEPTMVPLSTSARFGEAFGGSVPMRALFATLERAAETHESILLIGESGTGKELFARAIHERSARKNGPLVIFDCAAIATSLAESELFGHVKGAFTGADRARPGLFEQADGGTLFIDEMGELPLELQPKLLRALERREVRRLGSTETRVVDVRVVAATHRDLRKLVRNGEFREDLYYRLAVVETRIPPLRERHEDIPLIVEHLLAEYNPPRSLKDLPANALDLFKAHRWPGNVRELRNTVTRLLMFPHLGTAAIQQAEPAASDELGGLTNLPLKQARDTAVEQFELMYIKAKLRESAGNVTRAADSMGVTRQLVHRLMERHGIKSGS